MMTVVDSHRHLNLYIAHIVGGLIGGMAMGVILVAIGLIIPLDADSAVFTIAVLCLVAAVFDFLWPRYQVPTVHRQVPIHWKRKYRRSVAVLAYGAALGAGLFTRTRFPLTYIVAIAAAALPSPTGIFIMSVFGVSRAITAVVLARWFKDPIRFESFANVGDTLSRALHFANGAVAGLAAFSLASWSLWV